MPGRAKPLVYLVDDDPIMGRFVRKTLEIEGFEVREFQRGANFLDALPEATPDLVLLDLRMPSLSGEVVLEMLREQILTKPLRIVLYSSTSHDQLAEVAARYGVNGYLPKATPSNSLVDAVRKFLEQPPTFGVPTSSKQPAGV